MRSQLDSAICQSQAYFCQMLLVWASACWRHRRRSFCRHYRAIQSRWLPPHPTRPANPFLNHAPSFKTAQPLEVPNSNWSSKVCI